MVGDSVGVWCGPGVVDISTMIKYSLEISLGCTERPPSLQKLTKISQAHGGSLESRRLNLH